MSQEKGIAILDVLQERATAMKQAPEQNKRKIDNYVGKIRKYLNKLMRKGIPEDRLMQLQTVIPLIQESDLLILRRNEKASWYYQVLDSKLKLHREFGFHDKIKGHFLEIRPEGWDDVEYISDGYEYAFNIVGNLFEGVEGFEL